MQLTQISTDDAQVALLDSRMKELCDLQNALPKKIRSRLTYKCEPKRKNEIARRRQLHIYAGTDTLTISLLEKSALFLIENPLSIWEHGMTPKLTFAEPQAQLVACYLHAKSEDV